MKIGDLVRNKNSPSKRYPYLGIFLGLVTFKSRVKSRPDYKCAEVFWVENGRGVGTIQTDMLEVVCESG